MHLLFKLACTTNVKAKCLISLLYIVKLKKKKKRKKKHSLVFGTTFGNQPHHIHRYRRYWLRLENFLVLRNMKKEFIFTLLIVWDISIFL